MAKHKVEQLFDTWKTKRSKARALIKKTQKGSDLTDCLRATNNAHLQACQVVHNWRRNKSTAAAAERALNGLINALADDMRNLQ